MAYTNDTMQIDENCKRNLQEGKLLHQAIAMAAVAHKGQLRKGTQIDYLVHPMEVLEILSSMHADIHLRIAGVLHDTLEDTKVTLKEIRQCFGDDVANLVAGHTEDKALSWRERKQHHIDQLEQGTKRHRMLVLADSLSNIRSMAQDYEMMGDALWKRFHASKEEQAWYYHGMRQAMQGLEEDADTAYAYQEMALLCYQVFGQNEI